MEFGLTVLPDQLRMIDIIRNCITDQTLYQGTEDAFFVMDLGYQVRMAEQWKRLLPGVHPHYAVKANPDPVLLKMLARMDFGFDCASKVFNRPKIVYSNTRKQPSHLRYASIVGVGITVFDDEDELYKIKRISPNMKLLLRICTKGFTVSLTNAMGDKFGCQRENTKNLLKIAKMLGLEVIGVSFHVGCQPRSLEGYNLAIGESKRVFLEGRDLGFNMKLLDIGGGFPSETTVNYSVFSFSEVAKAIRKSLVEEFGGDKAVTVIAEPGSHFSRPSAVLVANIIGKRLRMNLSPAQEDTQEVEYFINDGIFSSFLRFVLMQEQQVLPMAKPVEERYEGVATKSCRIWGPCCTADDIVLRNCELPEMVTGDWIYFPDQGSYSACMNSEFNGFGRRPVYYYISESIKLQLREVILSAPFSAPMTTSNDESQLEIKRSKLNGFKTSNVSKKSDFS